MLTVRRKASVAGLEKTVAASQAYRPFRSLARQTENRSLGVNAGRRQALLKRHGVYDVRLCVLVKPFKAEFAARA